MGVISKNYPHGANRHGNQSTVAIVRSARSSGQSSSPISDLAATRRGPATVVQSCKYGHMHDLQLPSSLQQVRLLGAPH